ncbi:hypothetical protein CGMCC3_g9862 [Colletotrichum fructicola]|nr:uncharacterized protein CGMCC3_g9862 [Colletotrichum fructicola]KAE9574177.1 hypothetical protein CGMCC3_g9862 [Colletotrichum fructicola]
MADCVRFHTGCAWLENCRELRNHCVGVVYVPLSYITFPRNVRRELNPAISSRLASILEQDFNHDTCENAIDGYIDDTEAATVARKVGLSPDELKDTIFNGRRPTLRHTITCVDGLHRVEAAKAAFGENAMWTVRLWYRPGTSLPTVLFDATALQQLNRQAHQTPYSDGEVFRRICQLWTSGDVAEAQQWTLHLGVQKRLNIEKIRSNKKLLQSLSSLTAFPGLMNDLPLGSFHKHLALHSDTQIVCYLQHIHAVWTAITCGHPDAVDIITVQCLQGRAPGVSASDRDFVEQAFDNRDVFARVHNAQLRSEIQTRVLQLRRLIPSLRSFQENMKLFSIAASIVSSLLLPSSWKSDQGIWTLDSVLQQTWSRPRHNLIEVEEGCFVRVERLSSPFQQI